MGRDTDSLESNQCNDTFIHTNRHTLMNYLLKESERTLLFKVTFSISELLKSEKEVFL